jgi:hypothetical protein
LLDWPLGPSALQLVTALAFGPKGQGRQRAEIAVGVGQHGSLCHRHHDARQVVGESTPEPSTWAMMMLGFAGLGFAGYRKATSGIA